VGSLSPGLSSGLPIDQPDTGQNHADTSQLFDADLLFEVVTRRYEKRSLVLTTNLPFSEWPTIFPNAGSAIALIDRLIHHAEIITIEGESYRRRAAEVTRGRPLGGGH